MELSYLVRNILVLINLFFLKLNFVYKIILNTIKNTDTVIDITSINNVGSKTTLSPLKYPSGSSILAVNPSYDDNA